MKRFYTYLIIFLLPAYLYVQADCTAPDMQQSVVVFTRTSDEPTVDGEYSLAETKKVRFVGGNLLHQPSTGRWRIAPRQYDMVGGTNTDEKNPPVGTFGTIWETINGGSTRCTNDGTRNKNYKGWIDLFAWGTSGWYGRSSDASEDSTQSVSWRNSNNPNHKVTCNPYEYNTSANYILGSDWTQGMTGDYANADWGIFHNIELGGTEDAVFRTPTREEAIYLLRDRDNALKLRGMAHIRLICEADRSQDTIINGLVILPDNWDWENPALEGLMGKPFKSSADGYVYYTENEFTAAEWEILESFGAIFLPAAGGMGSSNAIKENRSGFYWSSTPASSNKSYDFQFGAMGYKPQMEEKQTERHWCRSVRLCQEITDKKGGKKDVINCDSYVEKHLNGVGGTITAVRNSSNHCLWTLTAHPAPGYKLAYWIDLYGGKSHENPLEIAINTEQPSIVWRACFVRSNAYVHEWAGDFLFFRSDTTNIFSYAGGGNVGLCIEGVHELDASESLDSIAPGLWRRTTSASRDNNMYAGKHIHFIMYDNCSRPTAVIDTIVPVMVYGDSLASAMNFHPDSAHTSVQVFDGATLTIDENTTFSGVLDIHAGGKVVVNADVRLTTEGIIMRGNGITGKWPQLIVNGNITNNNNDTIYYDYTLDQHAYYPLAFPYDVTCAQVRNPINRKSTGYQAYKYRTSTRATGVTGWAEFNDLTEDHFVAGNGYIIYAAPAKWKGTRQREAIMRFPMKHSFSSANEVQKPISIEKAAGEKVIDKNWNLIGNPYLANVTLDETDDETVLSGYAKWNDSSNEYELVRNEEDPDVRYITYSNNGFRTYIQSRLKGFTMSPFNCYFVQADDKASSITIALADRAASAPRRNYTSNKTETQEIETGLMLSQGDNKDHIGLLFGNYTDSYELNADLAKEFGEEQPMSAYSLMGTTPLAFQALSVESMARPIPLGYRKANMSPMTFSFDDSQYDRNLLDGLWLTDILTGQVTNLLVEDYTFTPESEQDDSRFYLSCERRKVVDVTTDVEEINQQRRIIRVYDMFGREMHGDVNALPQGVYILMDNLGNTSKEILGQ